MFVPGAGPGLDVEDVADLVGELLDVLRGRCPCCAGIWSIGIGTSGNRIGIDQRDDAERRVLGARSARPAPRSAWPGYGRPLKSMRSITCVRSSPVTVSVRWPRRRCRPATSCVGHHAVDQQLRRAVDGDDQDHAQRAATGACRPREQEDRVAAASVLLNVNVSWKPLGAARPRCVTVDAVERVEHDARHRHRHDRADHQREVDALSSIGCSRHAFRQRDAQASRRRSSISSSGRSARLASQRRQDCSGSPR